MLTILGFSKLLHGRRLDGLLPIVGMLLASGLAVLDYDRGSTQAAQANLDARVEVENQVDPVVAVAPAPEKKTALIEFQGTIHPISEQYFYRKIDEAKQRGAQRLVVVIDSPGGGIESTIRMGERLLEIDWADTIAFVPREALSGGAIFALAAETIAIAPNAVFGDAGPVFMDEDFLFKHAPEKIRSNLARRVRDFAQATGRPPALAEAMVDMDLVVYEFRNRDTGETQYMSMSELESLPRKQDWERLTPVHESREKHFLEVSGRRAVELGLAEVSAEDQQQLLTAFPPAGAPILLAWNRIDQAVVVLNHPLATGILLVIGLIAIYLEVASPGIGIGGLIATICFGLFFWSRMLGGTSDWLEIVLFVIGIALIIVEIFVLPGFGVWGLTGSILLLLSLTMASQAFLVPETYSQLTDLLNNVGLIVLAGAVFGIAAYMVTSRLGKLPLLNRFALQPPVELMVEPSTASAIAPAADALCEVGQQGITLGPLRPAGKVRFGRKSVDVVSDGTFIDTGESVQVVRVEGRRIVVSRVEPQS